MIYLATVLYLDYQCTSPCCSDTSTTLCMRWNRCRLQSTRTQTMINNTTSCHSLRPLQYDLRNFFFINVSLVIQIQMKVEFITTLPHIPIIVNISTVVSSFFSTSIRYVKDVFSLSNESIRRTSVKPSFTL